MSHSNRGRAALAALLTFALGGALPGAALAQDPAPPAAAPAGFVVDTVEVRGAQRLAADAVVASSGVRTGSVLNAQQVQEAIRRLMATGNFESVQVYVRGAEQGRGALVLDVRERPLVAGIEFVGLRSVSGATVRDSAGLRENAPLDPQRVAAAQKLTRDLLAARGIQLLSIDTALAPAEGGGVRLTFTVREGNRLTVAEIDFTGNEAFSEEQLEAAMSLKEEGFWWFRDGRYDRAAFEEDLRANLPQFYGRHGYIDFAIAGDTLVVDPATGKARLVVEVSEGPQYRLGEFNVQGNSRFPSEALAEVFTTQRRSVLGLPFGGESQRTAGEVFDQQAFNAAATEIEQQYRNEGYLYAQVIPSIERVPGGEGTPPRVNATLSVSEQQPFYIRQVAFRGNTTTHESVIRERIWVVPGDVYNEQRVIQSYQAISGLGFFEVPMPLPDIRPDPTTGQVDITFNVTEKNTGSVNFGTVFGGGPYGTTSSGQIAGFLSYAQPNLFGQGKAASIRAEVGYGRSTLEASYSDPSIGGGRNSGGVSVFRRGDRFVNFGNGRRLQTGASLQFGFPVPGSLRTRAFLGYSLSQTEYLSREDQCDAGSTSLFCLPDATASSLSLSVTRDTKNHPLFPTQGTRHSVTAEQTGGPLGGNGNYQKVFAQAEWWVPTGRLGSGARAPQMALGLSARTGTIFGNVDRFPFERFYVGGVMFGQPLRGYQESSVGPRGYSEDCNRSLQLDCLGDAFFTVSGEYALRLTDALSVSAFGDAGNVFGSVAEFNTSRLFRGAGVGATLVTPFLGAIGIDAAYGFDREEPGWEIHFKLGNQ